MNAEIAMWIGGSILVFIAGWVIAQSKQISAQDSRISKVETNIEWMRKVLTKIADKLDIKEI